MVSFDTHSDRFFINIPKSINWGYFLSKSDQNGVFLSVIVSKNRICHVFDKIITKNCSESIYWALFRMNFHFFTINFYTFFNFLLIRHFRQKLLFNQILWICLESSSKLFAWGWHISPESRKFHQREYWTLKTQFAT